MSQRTIILVRHGQREDHVDPEWIKTAAEPNDPDLSAEGVEQARRLARRVAIEKVDHLISSPFTRTLRTAQHLAEALHLPIHVEWGVGEQMDPGWFTGDRYPDFPPLAERKQRFPAIRTDYETMLVPQGLEPQDHPPIRLRAAKMAQLLTSRFEGNLLIVGHYASVNVLVEAFTGRLIPHYIDTCSFTKLVHDGQRWQGEILADMTYVNDGPVPS